MMAVKDLKEIIKDWPDTKEDGEPTEVWLETGLMLSSPATNHSRLGYGDFLLESNAFEKNN